MVEPAFQLMVKLLYGSGLRLGGLLLLILSSWATARFVAGLGGLTVD